MMGSRIVKAAIGLAVVVVAFFVYSYFFGSMYGGKEYQRKVFSSEARIMLTKYQAAQKDYAKWHGSYDPVLHASKQFEEFKNFKLAFKDNPIVEKICPDCIFEPQKYKVAAYGSYNSDEVVWVISENGNPEALK